MSGQTLNLQLDGDNCITVNLSESGRISLSDITAATIGDFQDECLEATSANNHDNKSSDSQSEIAPSITAASGNAQNDIGIPVNIPKTSQQVLLPSLAMAMQGPESGVNMSSWNNISTQLSHAVSTQSGPVLRPWESAAISAATSHVTTAQPIRRSVRATPPPSYQQHMFNSSVNQGGDKENQPIKRRKTDLNPMPGNLSEQISSFYSNIQSSPLSSAAPKFEPYSTLGNLACSVPTHNTSQLNTESLQPKVSHFHQPWSSVSRSGSYTNPLHSPSIKSAGVPQTANSVGLTLSQRQTNTVSYQRNLTSSYNSNQQRIPPNVTSSNIRSRPIEQQIFPHTLMKITDEPEYKPMTPLKTIQKSENLFESPGIESRLNNSLGLLGSPNMDSPLNKNPYFSDLQNLLTSECKKDTFPQSLFKMQEKEPSPEKQQDNVFLRERKLHERFDKLLPGHSEEVRQMSNFFRYQTALIETERFKTLHECKYPGSYKESIKAHFDNKLHQIMDRVEKSVELMEKADQEVKVIKAVKPRPHLNKEAVQLMEEWYSQNMDHPYPTPAIVEYLARMGNTGVDQVKKWFANKRNRSQNTRTLTEIAMKKRKLGQLSSSQNSF